MRPLRLLLCAVLLLGSATLAVLSSPLPALADPGCVDGGAYILFVRGSQEHFGDKRASAFRREVAARLGAAGLRSEWAELGDLNGDQDPQDRLDPGEYPAVGPRDWGITSSMSGYYHSVDIGVAEMVTHLNQRYGNGPGDRNCANETLIIGGYSQGAEVVGYAVSRLSATVHRHIGYMALFGDPRSNPQCDMYGKQAGWMRGDGGCRAGILGARYPYVPAWAQPKTSSWCDLWDGVCRGNLAFAVPPSGSHDKYQDYYIAAAAQEIAYYSVAHRNRLVPWLPAAMLPPLQSTFLPLKYKQLELPPAQDNTVLRTIHRTEPDGANVIYWAKACSVFETWWRPGKTSPKTTEVISISQCNIVDIDMHTKPGNIHLLYTATKSGAWETWWEPGKALHHALILPNADHDGAVRRIQKVMMADGTEQLYVMTASGVDEYWWRGESGFSRGRIMPLQNPVAMHKFTEPDGTQVVYLADERYVYETWWRNAGVKTDQIVHISQGGISGIDFSRDADGKHRLYTAEATGVWESTWYPGGGGVRHRKVLHDQGVRVIKKWNDNGTHVLYAATKGGVFEYYWQPWETGVHNGTIASGLSDVHDIDRAMSADGAQVVIAADGTKVKEYYWWPGGDGIRLGLDL